MKEMQNAKCKTQNEDGRRRKLSSFCILHFAFCVCLFGCTSSPPGKRPTDLDPKSGSADYWWAKPPSQTVRADDFDKIWAACRGELYSRLFPVDRQDYRLGLLSSEPVVSKQFFELWRTDAETTGDVAESSLATIRRTVRFEIIKTEYGHYEVAPKVLVERFSSAERRLTAITQYHQAFSGPRSGGNLTEDAAFNAIPTDYWYAVRRDTTLESEMAASIRERLE